MHRTLTQWHAALGIPLATLDTVPLLDVAIDGSDEARLRVLATASYVVPLTLAPEGGPGPEPREGPRWSAPT